MFRRPLLAALLLAFAATADAAVAPVSPAPEAVLPSSNLTFTWNTPAGETASAVYIATDPSVTPAGEFLQQNVSAIGILSGSPTSWHPETPLFAGKYWWSVRSTDAAFMSSYFAPSAFTIREKVKIGLITFKRRSGFGSYEIDVQWQANVKNPSLRARIRINGTKRTLFSKITPLAVTPSTIDRSNVQKLYWSSSKRLAPGTRATLVVELRGATTRIGRKLPLVAKS